MSNVDAVIPINADDPARGASDALVTLVVFTDLQCPFCVRFASTLSRLQQTHKDKSLRVVVKHLPLPTHPHALTAARVAEGVRATRGDEAFFRFHDLAFEHQEEMSQEALVSWAASAGADAQEIERGLADGTWDRKVKADMALAKRLGVLGTPHSFINGRSLQGMESYEVLEEAVSVEEGKASELVAQGVPRGNVYRVRAAENFAEEMRDRDREDDDEEEEEDSLVVANVPVAGSPVRGPATALVTIVEFSDFECPFCGRAEPTLKKLRETYGEKVRFVWKDKPLPFHKRALPAAFLAREARAQRGDAAFWKVHDRLFEQQRTLNDNDLEELARAVGLNVARAKKAFTGTKHQGLIDADLALAQSVDVSGTPHFFINGCSLVGAHPYEKFAAMIDEEIAKSEALIRSGVAPKALYETILKNAARAPEAAPSGEAKAEGATRLLVNDVKVGAGRAAKNGDTLLVHYTGTLTNGREFDSSRTHGSPFRFELGQGKVIQGWDRGLVGMKVGGRRKLTIPPALGYGARGAGAIIPPNTTLIFDVELLSIE